MFPTTPVQSNPTQALIPAPASPPPITLDPTIVNLAKAIRHTETKGAKDPYTAKGASGEFGAYQYTPDTWATDTQKYLGKTVPIEQADKVTQNEVAYKKLKSLKDQGYNVGQIASIWNSGSPEWQGKIGVNKKGVKYNVPQYVDAVANTYQAFKNNQTPSPQETSSTVGTEITPPPAPTFSQKADAESAQKYGAFFPASTENPDLLSKYITEPAKVIANTPKSAFNFAKGAIEALNPVSAFDKVKQAYTEFKGLAGDVGGYKNAFGALAKELPSVAYETLVPEAAKSIMKGDFETAQRAIVNDPVGQIAPFVLAAKGGANVLDRTGITKGAEATIDTGISKIASPVTKSAGYVFGGAKNFVGNTAKFAVGQATGLNPETISQVVNEPKSFTKEAQSTIDRGSLGKEVQSSLAKKASTLSSTGEAYTPIRESTVPVKVAPDWLDTTIKDLTRLDIKKGKIETTGAATLRDASDIRAIQHIYDLWKPVFKKGNMTANEFLNFRTDLANISKFERQIGKSHPVENVAKLARGKFNEAYRPQLKTLKELDKEFGTQYTELKQLSKGFVDKSGNLTDAAISRIANATGKGKDLLLNRLEQTVPGITQKIKLLKAVEDIQHASGIKVGTYGRAAIGVGLGVAAGVVPAIIEAVLTSPELAVPLLRRYGLIKNSNVVQSVVQALKSGGSAINQLPNPQERPQILNKDVKELNLPAGMSIEDVSKKIPLNEEGKGVFEIYSGSNPKTGFSLFKRIRSTPEKAQSMVRQLKKGGYAYLKQVDDPVLLEGINKKKVGEPVSLAQEVKKYNSAEEFVKAQGKTIYHHGSDALEMRGGTWLTDNPSGAGGARTGAKGRIDVVINENNLKLANNKQATEAGLYRGDKVKLIENLKAQGFDGIKSIVDGDKHYFIFDESNIKTKSQLTDLWNQANKKQGAFSPKETLYHGTAAKDFTEFKGINYFTKDPKEAEGFANGVHLGGGTGGTSRVLKADMPLRKVKDIDEAIQNGMFDEGKTDNEVVSEEIKKAKQEGYDAISFTHPSNYTDGEFTAYVPIDNTKISKPSAFSPKAPGEVATPQTIKNLPETPTEIKIFDRAKDWVYDVQNADVESVSLKKPDQSTIQYLSQFKPQNPIKLYRGIRPDQQMGKATGYESWTHSKQVAKNFSEGGYITEKLIDPKDILFDVKSMPAKIRREFISGIDELAESEVLVKSGLANGAFNPKPNLTLPDVIKNQDIKSSYQFGSTAKGIAGHDTDIALFIDEKSPLFNKYGGGAVFNKKVGKTEYHIFKDNDEGQGIFDAMLDMKDQKYGTGKGVAKKIDI